MKVILRNSPLVFQQATATENIPMPSNTVSVTQSGTSITSNCLLLGGYLVSPRTTFKANDFNCYCIVLEGGYTYEFTRNLAGKNRVVDMEDPYGYINDDYDTQKAAGSSVTIAVPSGKSYILGVSYRTDAGTANFTLIRYQ